MAALTETDIANFALGELGGKRIADLRDADSKNARVANLHYDQARKEVLRRHRWNFAMTRAELAQSSITPVWGWNYRFRLPSDHVRLAEVNHTDVWDYTQQAELFDIEGDNDGTYLMLNLDYAKIRYVSDITNPERFDALFTGALTALLAAKMARAITGDDKVAAQLREEYEKYFLPTAQHTDGVETRSNENSPLMDALRRSPSVRSRGGVPEVNPSITTTTTEYPNQQVVGESEVS